MGCLKTHIEWEPNLRLVYSKKGQKPLKNRINYYPFGLDHNYGLNAPMSIISGRDHKWKYNGQEQMKDLGVNVTEMDWRQYDNALGRFHGIDALAATEPHRTPYHFGRNNPIVFSDPSGLKVVANQNNVTYVDAGYTPYDRDTPHWTEAFGIGGGGASSGGGGAPSIASLIAQANAYINGDISANSTYTYSTQTTETISFAGDTNGFGQALLLTQTQHTVESLSIDMGDGNDSNGDWISQFSDGVTSANIFATVLEPSFKHAGSVTGNSWHPIYAKKNVFKSFNTHGNNAFKIGSLPSKLSKNLGKVLTVTKPITGVLAAGLVLNDIVSDGNISAGDVFLAVNTIAQFTIPAYGLIYSAVDLGFSVFSDKSLSNRIKDSIDNNIEATYNFN